MFSSRAPDHLAFLARHLAAMADELGVEEALARLSQAAPGSYAADISRLTAMVRGEVPEDTVIGLSPFATLGRLLRAVPGNRGGLLTGFVDYVRESRAIYDTFLSGIISFLWYVAAVTTVAITTTVIYDLYVFPAIANLLRSVDQVPPPLARLMFEREGALALLLLLVALLAGASACTLLFYRRIQCLRPMPHLPSWIPGVGRLCRTYNHGLMINFARLLGDSGLDPEQALSQAAMLAGHRPSPPPGSVAAGAYDPEDPSAQQLAIARRLGTMTTELRAQCDEHLGQLSMALLTVRERLSLVLKLVLFVYVGLLVVSMYQPIFQTNSVVG